MNQFDFTLSFKPFENALRRTVAVMQQHNEAIRNMDAELRALIDNRIYWTDTNGQPRRFEHRKPLLHKGRKP